VDVRLTCQDCGESITLTPERKLREITDFLAAHGGCRRFSAAIPLADSQA